MSRQFTSSWYIDKTLSGATTLGHDCRGWGYYAYPKAPISLNLRHQIILYNIQVTRGRESLIRLQRCSRWILQPLLSGQICFCISIHLDTCIYPNIYIYIYIYIYVSTYICIYTYTHIYIYICIYMYMYICIYIDIHITTHTHTHTHIYIYI